MYYKYFVLVLVIVMQTLLMNPKPPPLYLLPHRIQSSREMIFKVGTL